MKILLVHNTYQQRGGEDSVFEAEYRMLSKEGNEVEKLLFDNKTISTAGDKIRTGLGTVFNFKSSRAVSDAIARFKPDIIHVHNFFPLLSPAVFYAARKQNVPIVMTLHNFRLICSNALLFRDGHICESCVRKILPLNGILHRCYHNSFTETAAVTLATSFHRLAGTWKNKVNRYIALTEFGKNKILSSSLGLSPSQVTVKPNFVEDMGSGTGKREDFFVWIGRLSDEKRIEALIWSQKFHPYKLKIIGDGPLKNLVEGAAGRNKNIEYLGFRDKNFIMETLKRAKALLFTSSWYEGMPMTIIEALSAGTPVITPRIGGLPSIITDLHNGLLYRSGNIIDFVEKIKFIDEHCPESFYINARKTYEERFSPARNYEMLMSIYRDVIAKG